MKSLYVTHILEQESVALGGAAEKAGGIYLRLSTSRHPGGEVLDIEISQEVLADVVALVSEKRVVASVGASDDTWGPDVPLEDYEYEDDYVHSVTPDDFQADTELEAPDLDHDDDMAAFTPVD